VFETLVSSKIRRALLEHLLTHSHERFYLRGLAKELGLAVSPVRRELKRLEQLGVLKAYDEANIRFYVVDQQSPLFAQLKQAALPAALQTSLGPDPQLDAGQPANVLVSSTVISHPKIERIRKALRPRLSWPTLLGALSLSVVAVLALGGLIYLAVTNQRLLALTNRAVSAPRAQVTVVEPEPSASGQMRSSRWRLLPGALGGFSQGASEESY